MFMDINETIKSQLDENPIILYMKGSPQAPQCGFSAKTSQALMACGERFAFVNILDNQELREALKVYSSWPTYPQLYVNGELVGGCDIILEMSESGELAKLVKAAAKQAEA
jgi:monothiol glutaredoxin